MKNGCYSEVLQLNPWVFVDKNDSLPFHQSIRKVVQDQINLDTSSGKKYTGQTVTNIF